MFVNDDGEKIFQTLPGQGWQVLIDWDSEQQGQGLDPGDPRYTLEPVIAWVTAKIERKNESRAWEDVIIAPLVRSTFRDELVLLDSRDSHSRAAVYLAPGEKPTDEHFQQLRGASRKGVVNGPRD